MNASAIAQRRDVEEMNNNLQTQLTQQGMEFIQTDPGAFRETLIKAGFYKEWKQKYGEEAWNLLQKYSEKLG